MIPQRWILFILLLLVVPAAQAQTPTPPVDPDLSTNYMATATAVAGQVDLETNGTQVYFDNRALLPSTNNSNTVTTIAYTKWLFTTGAQAVFGPLTPILLSLAGLFLINLIFMLVYIWQNYIMTLIRAAWWVISLLIRLIRGA